MPIVRIELYRGRTAEQKAACARAVVDAVVQNLGTTAQATQVIFVEVDKADWHLGAGVAPPPTTRE